MGYESDRPRPLIAQAVGELCPKHPTFCAGRGSQQTAAAIQETRP
jgi:hypothetical protein